MIAWAIAALAVSVSVSAQEGEPPVPDRPAFERVLYLHGGPARDAGFWGLLRELGFSAVSASIGQDPAEPGRHGLRLYRDQLAGKGVLELRPQQIDPIRDAYEADRDPRVLARPACLADPKALDSLVRAVETAWEVTAPHRPLAVSIADEPSATRHVNPLDLCASKPFVDSFRAWLVARYGEVAGLNVSWNTTNTSFDEVEPWTADRIRARELYGVELPRNLAPWSDQLEFTDELFAAAVRAAIDRVAADDPRMPCGITGMQPPSAYGGYDYRRLMPGQSMFEIYPLGAARELGSSFAQDGALQFATLFPPAATDPAAMVDARLASMVAHGLAGVVVWSAGEIFEADGEPTRFGADLAHAWSRLAPVAERFGRARSVHSPVWLVESQASVRAHWMLDSSRDGPTWLRRLSSHEAANSTSMAARESWVRLLEDLGLQPRFVAAEDLVERLERAPPRLLVLPVTLALADDAVAAIRRYSEQGGHVVADHGTAIYDERLRRRPRGALDDLFGLTGRRFEWSDQLVLEGRGDPRYRVLGSGLAVAERGLRGRVGEEVAEVDADVQIESRVGVGRATYLNLAVCEYSRMRLDPEQIAAARDLRARLRRALEAAGVQPPVLVIADGLPTCIERVVLRSHDGGQLLAVRVNALGNPAIMRTLGEQGARRVELVFPRAVRLTDVATGAELGTGERIEIDLDPWIGAFLAVEEPGR